MPEELAIELVRETPRAVANLTKVTRENTLANRVREYLAHKTAAHSTMVVYSSCLQKMVEYVGNDGQVDTPTIFYFFRAMKAEGMSVSTLRQRREVVRGFFQWCVHMGYMTVNPCAFLPKDLFAGAPAMREPFTEEEYKRLLWAASGTEWYYAIMMGWHTALRFSDIAVLRWVNVQFDHPDGPTLKVAPMKTVKHGTVLEIPIHPDLNKLLTIRWHNRNRKVDYVCEEMADLFLSGNQNYSNSFRRIADKAGTPAGKTFHCLRHAACSRMVNTEGSDLITVASITGHTKLETLRRYVKVAPKRKKFVLGFPETPK